MAQQIMQVHDARIPFSGRNLTFRDVVGGARPHLLILNKADLIPESDQEAIRRESMRQSPHISRVFFTNCKSFYCPQTAAIIPTVSKLVGGEDRSLLKTRTFVCVFRLKLVPTCRWHRAERPDSTLLVVGIPNVGKSSLINKLRSDHLKVHLKSRNLHTEVPLRFA